MEKLKALLWFLFFVFNVLMFFQNFLKEVTSPDENKVDETLNGAKPKRRSGKIQNSGTLFKSEEPTENSNTKLTKTKTRMNSQAHKLSENKTKEANINWDIGALVEARDRSSDIPKYYKSKIIDKRESEVKIHFLGWNSRYDQWYAIESGDLKPCLEEIGDENLSVSDAKEFEIGTQIMVKWKKDGNFYPATIKRLVEKERKKFKSTFFNGISTNKERKKCKMPN